MRSRIIIIALILAVLPAVTASAQVPAKPVSVYIGGGVSVPTGTLADGWKMGFHGNGKIGFSAMPKLDLMGSIAYHNFPGKDLGAGSPAVDVVTMVLIGADVRKSFGLPSAPTKPFLLAGGGLGILTFKEAGFLGAASTTLASDNKPYAEFGGGVELQKFFAEVKYVIVFTSGKSLSFLPITIGYRFF